MKYNTVKIVKILIFIIFFLMIFYINNKVQSATAKINVSPAIIHVGDKITVKITGNAASWSNLTLKASGQISGNGGIMADVTDSGENENVTMGTYTFTATSVGNATFTLSGLVVNSDYTTNKISDSETVQIIKKEEPKQETAPPTNTNTPSINSGTTNNKTTNKQTVTNTSTTSKNTTTSTTQQKEEKQDDFYINKVVLTGVKENDEKVNISLSPEFQKDIYEYTCHVGAEIQKLELEKEAGDYTNSIIVTGLDDLKEGENSITLQLAAENHEAKTYTIKVIKEAQKTIENVVPVGENVSKTGIAEIKTISMPLWVFIVMQILIIVIEVLAIYFIPWRNLLKKKIDID